MNTRWIIVAAAVFVILVSASAARAQCPPATPTGVSASDGTLCTGVYIRWNAVSGADSYQVWFNIANNYSQSQLLATVFDTDYTHVLALPGQTYYYWVRAFRTQCLPPNNYGSPSSATTGYRGTTPSAPTNLQASDGTFCTGVELTWNGAGGTQAYEIYWNVENSYSSSVLLGVASGCCSYMDVAAVNQGTRYYWVRATTVCGNSGPSNGNSGYAATEPPVPENLTATQGTSCLGVSITWDEMPSNPLFQVWRSTTQNFDDGMSVGGFPGSNTFLDQVAVPYVTYHYWIRTVTACGTGEWSARVSGIRGAPPLAVSDFTATTATRCDGVMLEWLGAVGIPEITGQRILRGTTAAISEAVDLHELEADERSYLDTDAQFGIEYRYWIICVSDCGPGIPVGPVVGFLGDSDPLRFTEQPAAQTIVRAGQRVVLHAAAAGTPEITYRWRHDSEDLEDGGSISGAGTPTLTIDPVSAADAGSYRVRIANNCAVITSDLATLTVRCAADFNLSGTVTAQDVFDFLAAFFTPGSLAADFNRSGAVTAQDVFDYLAAFFGSCP